MVDRIPQQDLEALNAYLDGELSAAERSALESRLSQEPALQTELDALRATIGILGELERVPVPRSFTLDPAVYGRKPGLLERLGLTGAMPLMAGAAAVVVAVICVGAVILGGGLAGRSAPSPEVAMGDMAEEESAAEPAMGEAIEEEEMEEEEPAEEEPAEEEEAPAEEMAEEAVEAEMAMEEAPVEDEAAAAEPRPEGGGGEGGGMGGGGPEVPAEGDGPLPDDEFIEITPDQTLTADAENAAADEGGAGEVPPAAELPAEGEDGEFGAQAQVITDTPENAGQALPLTQSEEPSIEATEMTSTQTTPSGPNLAPVLAVAGIVLAVVLVVAVVVLTRRRSDG